MPRKTPEKFNLEIYALVQDEYTVLGTYTTNKTKLLFRHNICGYEWNVEPSSFLKGCRCPKCQKARFTKTTEQFKQEVCDIVGNEYSVLGKYININTPIKMRHNTCGDEFMMIPNNFLHKGNRCNKCGIQITGEKNSKNDNVFKKEIFNLVGTEYSVLTKYKNCNTEVLFKHNKCGNEFMLKPTYFTNGVRCPKCSLAHRVMLRTKPDDIYKNEVKEKFGDEYLVYGKFIKGQQKMKYKHLKCGYEFTMYPNTFIKGCGCPKCSHKMKMTTELFKQEVFDLVADEYSVVGEYQNAHAKIEIRHNSCGTIYKTCRHSFLKGNRCPCCATSKGEEAISRWLDKNIISYESQKTYKDLIGTGGGLLSYDFYLPNYNLLVEFNGIQHYKPVPHFGGEKTFENQKEHDRRKLEYANNNNIGLLSIRYSDYRKIDEILQNKINEIIKEVA